MTHRVKSPEEDWVELLKAKAPKHALFVRSAVVYSDGRIELDVEEYGSGVLTDVDGVTLESLRKRTSPTIKQKLRELHRAVGPKWLFDAMRPER